MIREWLARAGIALLKKSGDLGFSAQNAEALRKYFAIHPQIARVLGYSEPSYSGKSINEYSALNISTVWACVRVISESVATLPLRVLEDTGTSKRLASEHPLDWVLHREANSDMSAFDVRQAMTAHVLTWGNAFALKVKRGGTKQTIGLWPLTPDLVRVDQKDGQRIYRVRTQAGQEKIYQPDEIFHLPGYGYDGIQGYSVVSQAKQSLGLAAIQDEYAAKFFARGGRRPYVLEKATRFRADEDYEKFKEAWTKAYASADGFHSAPILEGDIKYHELGMPLEDMQLLTSRQFSVADICRWFLVPPHMVGDLSRATFTNIEHQGLEFVQQTLSAWLERWEQGISRQLLTDGEKGKYYAKHNLSARLRGDFKSRMDGYSVALQNGFMNRDEVRALEDWNPMPDGAGQAYTIQLNMQRLPAAGQALASETAALAKSQQTGGQDNAE